MAAAVYAVHPGFTPSPCPLERRERRRGQLLFLRASEQFQHYLQWSWVAPGIVGPPPNANDLAMSTRQWKWQLMRYSKAIRDFHRLVVLVRMSL